MLGIGNLSVGFFKGQQYERVLQELAGLEPTPGLVNASPLRRIQLAKQTANRTYQRQQKAQARLDLYRLVTFGGKVFVTLSIIFLFSGSLVRYFQYLRNR